LAGGAGVAIGSSYRAQDLEGPNFVV
jgi:hypothetical protein